MPDQDLLETLSVVKKQLQTSYDGLAQLSRQHRDWQRSLESLLTNVEQQCQPSVEPPQVQTELPAADKDAEPGAQIPQGGQSVSPLGRFLTHSKTLMGFAPRDERFKNVGLHKKRISSLHPLLQSRKSVQQCPAGPLRKLLREMLPKTEAPAVQRSPAEKVRDWATRIASSTWFEYAVGLVIFLNILTIGFEAELSLRGGEFNGFWFLGVERLFLSIYLLEALFRIYSFGWILLWDAWFLFDLLLVFLGALTLWVVPSFAGSDTFGFQKLLVMRSLRLLRLMRVLRMTRQFKIIWRFVFGFLTAWETISAAAALLLMTLFVFSCIAIEFIAKDADLIANEVTQPVVSEYFFGLGRAMLTLAQFVTLDGLREVYFPLVLAKPWLGVYFFAVLLVVSVGLLNLVTACFVEQAMDNAAITEKEERSMLKEKVQGALPSLIALFDQLDTDGSGLLTREEVDNVPLEILPPRVLDSVYVDSMRDVFDLLDVNECGFLTQTEFVEGLLNLCLLDMPIATMQNLNLLKNMHDQLARIELLLSQNAYEDDDVVIAF